MGISVIGGSAGGGYKKYSQTFNSSTTWTAPDGVTSVDVALVGGGGGGGAARGTTSNANNRTFGGGGGGGVVQRGLVTVTPGTTYTVTVGAGGAGATDATYAGGKGGYSSFAFSGTLANGFWHSGEYNIALSGSQANYSRPALGGWFCTTYNGAGYNLTNPVPYTDTSYQPSSGRLTNNIDVTSFATGVSRNGLYISNLYPNGVSNQYGDINNWVAVSAGTTYIASGYFCTNDNSGFTMPVAIRIEWYNGLRGTFISATNGTSTTLNSNINFSTPVLVSTSAAAPTGATYALIRYQAYSPSNNGKGFRLHGAKFETGSTVTEYKTLGTPGTVFNGSSIFVPTSGIVAAGGGGGGSADQNSGYDVYPELGGGSGYQAVSTDNYVGGHGAGYSQPIPSTFRLAASTTGASYQNSYAQYEAASPYQTSPMPVVRYGSSAYHAMGVAPGNSPEGWGAGGIGGWNGSGSIEYIYYGMGAGTGSRGSSAGNNALANTGAGGGGASCPSVAATYAGGNGGSGQVIISWMGA